MSSDTMMTRIYNIHTGSYFDLHYPAYPEDCDMLTVVNPASGESMTLPAEAFEDSSVDALAALAALVEFTGGFAQGKEFSVFDVVGVDNYRIGFGTEDIQFAVYQDGEWFESAYWHIDELVEDTRLVLGAICGALNSVDEVDEDDAVESALA